MEKPILFISNGYGEDTIACSILECLKKKIDPDWIVAFPLVGTGDTYRQHGIPVISPTRLMPSGGLFPEGYLKNIWQDLRSGLAALTLRQIRGLKDLRKKVSLVVAVGDTFPVIMGGMFTGMQVIFVGTAKSDYFDPYSSVEMGVFRKFTKKVFPRDEITASSLRKGGVNAEWVGNAMMDSLEYTGDRFGIPAEKKVITVLPGSRDSAYRDFPILLQALIHIENRTPTPYSYVAPLAGSTDLDEVEESCRPTGFVLEKTGNTEGVVGKLVSASGRAGKIFNKNESEVSDSSASSVELLLLRGRFADAVGTAELVIGQAGTGNEQAAGLGKPVIGFDSGGRKKAGWYRARQKGLLGDALAVVPRDPERIAEKAISILQDSSLYNHMALTGKERLGPPGGAERMADFMYQSVRELHTI